MKHRVRRITLPLLIAAMVCSSRAQAINITVDYRYDTNDFFDTQQKRNALEAAAARYSAIITTSLSAASLTDNGTDPRIGFTHPGLGAPFDVSAAISPASDALASTDIADEYRGPWSIAANQWVLYAGGRPLNSAGIGGTGTGLNFPTVFANGNSHLNRGFRATGSVSNLPVWGGAIIFDDDDSTTWHFDVNTVPPISSLDFYSIALHEIGHALGLSAGQWIDWNQWAPSPSSQFTGPDAVAAYNSDNGTSLSALNLVSSTDHHWQDNTYDSRIFNNGNPNYVGTVGAGNLQDLLMEPVANFTQTRRRFELTNVDVAALQDIGWSVIPTGLPGDFNRDGTVNAADYVVWRKGAATGSYATWRANFGESTGSGSAVSSPPRSEVPEPAGTTLCGVVILASLLISRRVVA